MPPPPTKTSPPIKTPTRSSMRGRRGTRSAAAPTLLPITSTPGAAVTAAASAGIESIGVYLAIAISARINIVYKQVTNIVKDIQAIDRRLNKFRDSLNKIKNKLAFLRRSIIALIRNAGLLNIK